MSTTTTHQDTYDPESTTSVMRLNALALAGAAAVVSAIVMLLLGVFGAIGVYEGAVEAMEQWHLFFEPTVVGTVAGMVEAAVISFALAYALAWLYNTLAR
ncbi:hypothetical protein NDI54_18120 [Haloarcula sp. S1AR25-5A]|jgi:hypothetical protein|uniref:Uncharacterized protein n=2 Tax=Haloarcula TaxID=2237 RepID=A0AAE4F1T0_9EURY|nr:MULTISPECIES: hypothetical protein [Halobacteria]MDS0223262.1 hypothetical protein [Haloarcula terrestris]MDS0284410.1 hypothetical protein [Halomicroarcula sp. S3CR25-11]MDS0478204.1 hypothetical protein [Natrinema sp. 1APR25-10V2]